MARLDHPMKERGAVMIREAEMTEVTLSIARDLLVCLAELLPLDGCFYLLTVAVSRQ